MDKRSFLKNVGLMSLAVPLNFLHVHQAVAAVGHLSLAEVAGGMDDELLLEVQQGNFDTAIALSLILLAIIFVVVGTLTVLQQRRPAS